MPKMCVLEKIQKTHSRWGGGGSHAHNWYGKVRYAGKQYQPQGLTVISHFAHVFGDKFLSPLGYFHPSPHHQVESCASIDPFSLRFCREQRAADPDVPAAGAAPGSGGAAGGPRLALPGGRRGLAPGAPAAGRHSPADPDGSRAEDSASAAPPDMCAHIAEPVGGPRVRRARPEPRRRNLRTVGGGRKTPRAASSSSPGPARGHNPRTGPFRPPRCCYGTSPGR